MQHELTVKGLSPPMLSSRTRHLKTTAGTLAPSVITAGHEAPSTAPRLARLGGNAARSWLCG